MLRSANSRAIGNSVGQNRRGSAIVLAAILMLGACSKGEPDPKSTLAGGASKLLQFYATGDTSGLRAIFTESEHVEIDISGLLQQRNDFAVSLGALRESKGPQFLSDSEATMQLYFENKNLEMFLGFDSVGRIVSLGLNNLAPDSLIPHVAWADLGDDTLQLGRSPSFVKFRDDFVRDSGRVRVVALLSPT